MSNSGSRWGSKTGGESGMYTLGVNGRNAWKSQRMTSVLGNGFNSVQNSCPLFRGIPHSVVDFVEYIKGNFNFRNVQ